MDKKVLMKKEIGLFGGVSILTGIMVGSGIFFIGSYVLMRTEFSLGLALLVWLLGGLITLAYGLIYAELGATYPFAGGYYVYLKKAYGKPIAFMSGFMNFTIASSGSIAVLALAFSLILSNVFGVVFGFMLPKWLMIIISITMIAGLSLLNFFGVKIGTTVLKVFMVVKAIPIVTILILGLFMGTQSVSLSLAMSGHSFFHVLSMIGFAVIATFWAYEGWTNLNSVAEEIERPDRNLPLSLIVSIGAVTALYVLFNYSIFRVLSVADMRSMIEADQIFIGIPAAMQILGSIGMYVVMLTMLISVAGALNGTIMTFPRVYYAMGRDDLFIKQFSALHPKYKTPYYAIVGSAVMSIILLLLFDVDALISLVAFGIMVFNILIFLTVFIFRKREPDIKRPYKTWGYPVLPAVAILVTMLLLIAIFTENIRGALFGSAIILLGLPVYFFIEHMNKE